MTNEATGGLPAPISTNLTPAARTRSRRALPPTPSPVLKPHAVYFGDNGRALCATIGCGGMSALYSGYDLSGHRVERASVEDCREWEQVVGRSLTCECGGTTLSTVAGSDGWPVAIGGVA